ncbi:MAG: glycosyltransferase [Thermoguttaceae bacterium]|nr:glycosyltransferase [Thermoguttaceae bacterium]
MKLLLLLCNGRLTQTVGGKEKVFCEFANEFVRRGWEVGAAYDALGDAPPVFQVDSRVRLFNLNGLKRPPLSLWTVKVLREATRPFCRRPFFSCCPNLYETARRRLVRPKLDALLNEFRPDVVVPFSVEDAETLFYRRPKNDFATVLTTHNAPDAVFRRASSAKTLKATLDRCDVVQALLPSFVPAIRAVASTEIVVVPNVVPQFPERVDVERREREGNPRIICVARFDKRQKRQRLLIEAFAKIAARRPDWRVFFFGDPYPNVRYRDKLVSLVSQLKLENRILIHSSTPRIKDELLKSDIFALPSAYEGFSLALTEAQSLGLPTLGFADAPSVNELIVDGENGFLAADVDDFAQKLDALIESKELRARFGSAARKSVEPYEASRVWNRWERLLVETVEKKGR